MSQGELQNDFKDGFQPILVAVQLVLPEIGFEIEAYSFEVWFKLCIGKAQRQQTTGLDYRCIDSHCYMPELSLYYIKLNLFCAKVNKTGKLSTDCLGIFGVSVLVNKK